MVVTAAMCLVTPAICMDYFTGQSSRRTLKQGPGGITCQGQYQSAQYRCNSLQSRPNNYQFCVRLCDTDLGRARAADNNQSPSLVGGAGNSSSTVTGTLGGRLGGASLGGSGLIASGGGGGAAGCVPCQDVQQKCQEGASLGGNSQQYYQPYVQRYYTGLGCVDAGPNVKPAAATAAASTSPSASPSSSPRSSPSPA
ncbi:g3293 [Coccomyxa elongata]